MIDRRVPFGDVWVAVASVGGLWLVFVYLVMDVAPSGTGVRPVQCTSRQSCGVVKLQRCGSLVLVPIGDKLQRKTRLSVWAARDPRNRRVSE